MGDPSQMLQESLWEAPVYETSLAEYVEYIQDLERMDPDCLEETGTSQGHVGTSKPSPSPTLATRIACSLAKFRELVGFRGESFASSA